jgi:hypothetical protein
VLAIAKKAAHPVLRAQGRDARKIEHGLLLFVTHLSQALLALVRRHFVTLSLFAAGHVSSSVIG